MQFFWLESRSCEKTKGKSISKKEKKILKCVLIQTCACTSSPGIELAESGVCAKKFTTSPSIVHCGQLNANP
jgi:hypothetical protein